MENTPNLEQTNLGLEKSGELEVLAQKIRSFYEIYANRREEVLRQRNELWQKYVRLKTASNQKEPRDFMSEKDATLFEKLVEELEKLDKANMEMVEQVLDLLYKTTELKWEMRVPQNEFDFNRTYIIKLDDNCHFYIYKFLGTNRAHDPEYYLENYMAHIGGIRYSETKKGFWGTKKETGLISMTLSSISISQANSDRKFHPKTEAERQLLELGKRLDKQFN